MSVLDLLGTHFMWEVMTMLLGDSSDYSDLPKEGCMMDLFPLSETVCMFPQGKPKVLNTHFRPDVLPKAFRERKTVVGKLTYISFGAMPEHRKVSKSRLDQRML